MSITTDTIFGILIPFLGTSLGAAMVFVLKKNISDNLQKILTGFAAGVMVAASFWSLLQPALESSEGMGTLSFIPAAVGFLIGVGFLLLLDDDFMIEGIRLGDTVRDASTGLEFTVVGFARNQMYGHVSIGFITTEAYTELRTALNPHYEQTYHAIAVKGDVSGVDIDGCELVSKEDVIQSIPSYSAEHTTINMIVWVLVIVSAVVIGIFSYILTLQKRKQFGVMKAVGLGMGRLASIVISQNLLLSIFAAVIANLLTFGMSAVLPQTMPFYLQVFSACMVSVVFLVISVLSSLLSIINISRIDPIQAIGGYDE